MPKITDMQIQKNNKTRANVFIDGEYAFALEMLTVMKLGLKIGQEVSEDKLREAMLDSEKSVAFERAMGYVARGLKTEKQMRDYLLGKSYEIEVVEFVIDRLKQYRYIDDEQYAKLYVERNLATKGERRLRQELLHKGIATSLAEQQADVEPELALANARALAEKYLRNKPLDLKTLSKLQRYLVSRGYDYDVVNTVVRSYNVDN